MSREVAPVVGRQSSVDGGILTAAKHAGDPGKVTRSRGSRPGCEVTAESSPRDPKPVACVPSTGSGVAAASNRQARCRLERMNEPWPISAIEGSAHALATTAQLRNRRL